MSSTALFFAFAAIVTASYFGGRSRALAVAGGRLARLKALPVYHGAYVALATAIPGLLFLAAALMVEPWIVSRVLDASLPEHVRQMASGSRALWMTDVHRYLAGDVAATAAAPEVVSYGDQLQALQRTLTVARAKIAEALVMGRAIRIEGGNIKQTAPLPCDTAMPRRLRRHGPPWANSTDTTTGGRRGRGGKEIEPSDQQPDPR